MNDQPAARTARFALLTSVACAIFHVASHDALAQGRDTVAATAPRHGINCGTSEASPLWARGAVFADSSVLESRSRQKVAAVWCGYLATGAIPELSSPTGGWTDAQLGAGFPLDLGIEWARAERATSQNSRIRFRVEQIDTGNTEHLRVLTTIERADKIGDVLAEHALVASVRNDTVQFESALVPMLASNMRWIASPFEYVRLDSGAVDAEKAKAAAAFVADTRARLGLKTPASENILYLFTRSNNGAALLGFSKFPIAIDGFSSNTPIKFVFANVSASGELYKHELVRVALMSSPKPVPQTLNEALAKTLGSVSNATFAQYVCENRNTIAKSAGVSTVAALFAQPDATAISQSALDWELALLVEYARTAGGDAALRKLLAGPSDFSTRQSARSIIAAALGSPVPALLSNAAGYFADSAIAARCN